MKVGISSLASSSSSFEPPGRCGCLLISLPSDIVLVYSEIHCLMRIEEKIIGISGWRYGYEILEGGVKIDKEKKWADFYSIDIDG